MALTPITFHIVDETAPTEQPANMTVLCDISHFQFLQNYNVNDPVELVGITHNAFEHGVELYNHYLLFHNVVIDLANNTRLIPLYELRQLTQPFFNESNQIVLLQNPLLQWLALQLSNDEMEILSKINQPISTTVHHDNYVDCYFAINSTYPVIPIIYQLIQKNYINAFKWLLMSSFGQRYYNVMELRQIAVEVMSYDNLEMFQWLVHTFGEQYFNVNTLQNITENMVSYAPIKTLKWLYSSFPTMCTPQHLSNVFVECSDCMSEGPDCNTNLEILQWLYNDMHVTITTEMMHDALINAVNSGSIDMFKWLLVINKENTPEQIMDVTTIVKDLLTTVETNSLEWDTIYSQMATFLYEKYYEHYTYELINQVINTNPYKIHNRFASWLLSLDTRYGKPFQIYPTVLEILKEFNPKTYKVVNEYVMKHNS